jgi:hypothetical protein
MAGKAEEVVRYDLQAKASLRRVAIDSPQRISTILRIVEMKLLVREADADGAASQRSSPWKASSE